MFTNVCANSLFKVFEILNLIESLQCHSATFTWSEPLSTSRVNAPITKFSLCNIDAHDLTGKSPLNKKVLDSVQISRQRL